MSDKIWFKKRKETKESKFKRFCEERGADFFENECGVWIMPKRYGTDLSAIKLQKDKTIQLGRISEECMNFQPTDSWFYFEEIEWFAKIVYILKKK